MIFVDDLKWAIGVMLHPGQNTKKSMDSIESFIQYYKASVIPTIFAIIIEILLAGVLASPLSNSIPKLPLIGHLIASFAGAIAVTLLIASTLALVWIFVPIGFIFNSLVFHIVGKYLFRVFKNEYDTTATAFSYSAAPLAVLSWTIVIPFVGIAIVLMAIGWQVTILVYSLANQENISKAKASLLIFVLGIIAWIAGFVFVL